MRSRYWIVLSLLLLIAAAAAIAWWRSRSGPPNVAQTATQPAVSSAPLVGSPAPAATGSLPQGPTWFGQLSQETGIVFRHHSGTSAEKPFPAANGSGLAALDYDLDGRYDLYFASGTPFPINAARSEPSDHFYRNVGRWKFENATASSGLGHNGYSAGLAVGDYDGDGFSDLYVTCYGANCLYHNQGDGTFQRVDQSAQVADPRWATSAAFLDYDSDGLLDLYVCNYAQWTWETNRFCGDRQRNVRIYCSPHSVKPELDILYRNQGDGTFQEVTTDSGLAQRAGRAQGVVAADLNSDGLIDLYIGNDLHANSLFLNQGDGTFQDASDISGVAYDHRGKSQAGMGVDAADVNRDGRFDLFVTNFQGEHNALYESQGYDLFQEVSHRQGLAAKSLPWVGWGTVFADFNLDGWCDLIVTNGHVDDNRHLLGQDAPYAQPALAWQNVEGRFRFLGAAGGGYFAQPHVGRGLALADLDNDGDQDLAVGHQDAAPTLLCNQRLSATSSQACSMVLRLVGTRSNRDAVGSTITLRRDSKDVVQHVKGGGSYLSAHDLRQVFAVEPAESGIRLDIRWPDRHTSTITDLEAGRHYVVIEPFDPATSPSLVALEPVR